MAESAEEALMRRMAKFLTQLLNDAGRNVDAEDLMGLYQKWRAEIAAGLGPNRG